MSGTAISDTILIARQPILDSKLSIFAYELLFRGSDVNESCVDEFNGDLATTQVINNAFMEFGIERLIGNKRAFINLTQSYITGEIELPFDPSHVVLEVLEDIEVTDEVVSGIQKYAEQGFTIALDDFIYSEEQLPLIEVASIIKIDILALTEAELIQHVALLKTKNVKLLAEKVETYAQYEQCKNLGFEYFQGYFFCQPKLINGKALPENKLAVLRILKNLQNPDVTMEEIEHLIREDVSLSFKLLRLLNSAAVCPPKRVESIKQGLIFLGLKSIKSWATVIAFSDLEVKITELMTTALMRAKMASELATYFQCDKDAAFITGLFSLLDAIAELPMKSILHSLLLDEDINHALLQEGKTPLGELLLFIIKYESGHIDEIPSNITFTQLNNAYLAATEWVNIAEQQL